MSKLADYRSKAEFCDSEARQAGGLEIRDVWRQIRDSYRHLADREQRIAQERLEHPRSF